MKNRTLLMIPGPIEFDPAVMQALGQPTTSHVAADFIEIFGRALERTRQVFLCPNGQPFVVAGSGTLALDMAAANLVQPGDLALVVNTGYFSERFGAMLQRYGAKVASSTPPWVMRRRPKKSRLRSRAPAISSSQSPIKEYLHGRSRGCAGHRRRRPSLRGVEPGRRGVRHGRRRAAGREDWGIDVYL